MEWEDDFRAYVGALKEKKAGDRDWGHECSKGRN